MVITIDGIAASGKSTIGLHLGMKLGLPFLDSGSIYRTITARFLEINAIEDEDRVTKLFASSSFINTFIANDLKEIAFRVKNDHGNMHIHAFGKEYTSLIHTPLISRLTPITSAPKKIRELARIIQHEMADHSDIIIAGRDIGSIVFPDAKYKFFVTIDDNVRAKKRLLQHKDLVKDSKEQLEELINDLKKRDEQDKNHKHGALQIPKEAIIIDNSFKSIEEIIANMLTYIHT